jgi:hypothetical protein
MTRRDAGRNKRVEDAAREWVAKGRGMKVVERRHVGTFIDHGVRAKRFIGVDASGLSGAAVVLVMADRLELEDGDGNVTPMAASTWRLPILPKVGAPAIDGNRFRLGGKDGPALSGLLLGPAKPAVRDATTKTTKMVVVRGRPKRQTTFEGMLEAAGEGIYVAVLALHATPGLELAAEGTGADAVVRIGKRTVQFDGKQIVFGK